MRAFGGSILAMVVVMVGMGILTVAEEARSLRGGLTGSFRVGFSSSTVSGATGCVGCCTTVVGAGATGWSLLVSTVSVGLLVSTIGVGGITPNVGMGSADEMTPMIGSVVATTGRVSTVIGSVGSFSFSISVFIGVGGGPNSRCILLLFNPRAKLVERLRRFRESYWSKWSLP